MANDLLTLGVAVVPVMDEESRSFWEDSMWQAIRSFPEYKRGGREMQRVLGGFGALGNPSSFHDPLVRTFRSKLKRLVMMDVFREYSSLSFGSSDGIRIESLFDRLCVRYEPFLRPGKEAWHRDIYDWREYKTRELPRTLPVKGMPDIYTQEDLLFGGWTNLSSRDQSFVCLLGSHNEPVSGKMGFATFEKEEIQKFRFDERLLSQGGKRFGDTIATNGEGEVVVPPGHSVLFFQKIIHSVKSGPQPDTPSLRLFHGFRMTREEVSLFQNDAWIENCSVPRIPSGQFPPMFSKNHFSQFSKESGKRWREWGFDTFKEQCLFERTSGNYTYKVPGSKGNRNQFVNKNRMMPSLSEMGLLEDRFVYSPAEREILTPQPL